jgi:hypothetical protein
MYATPAAPVFTVTAADATTATLTSSERRPYVGAGANWPSQIVLTFPNATPPEFIVGAQFIIPVTSK